MGIQQFITALLLFTKYVDQNVSYKILLQCESSTWFQARTHTDAHTKKRKLNKNWYNNEDTWNQVLFSFNPGPMSPCSQSIPIQLILYASFSWKIFYYLFLIYYRCSHGHSLYCWSQYSALIRRINSISILNISLFWWISSCLDASKITQFSAFIMVGGIQRNWKWNFGVRIT